MTIFEMINEYELELHYDSRGDVHGLESYRVELMGDECVRHSIEEHYVEIMRVLCARKNKQSLLRVENERKNTESKETK